MLIKWFNTALLIKNTARSSIKLLAMKKIFTLCLFLTFLYIGQGQSREIRIERGIHSENTTLTRNYNRNLLALADKSNFSESSTEAMKEKLISNPENKKSISIRQNPAPNANAPITTLGSVSSCPNASFNLPITVTNFTNIGALTLRLDYDTNLLRYNGYSNVNSVFLSNGMTVNANMDTLSMRKINIVWYTYPNGINLANGSKLLDLNFTIKTGSPSIQFNNISNSGGDCEYADALGNAYTDSPTSTYYINPVITNLGASNPGTISGSTSVCRNQNNEVYAVPSIPNATSYVWTLPTGASGSSTTSSITVNYGATAVSGDITVKGYNSTCGNGNPASLPITVTLLPVAAGSISGSATVCSGQNNVAYNIPSITNATSYIWTYSGSGATINGNSNNISISFSPTATSGNLTVKGSNFCGVGTISANYPITINPLPSAAGSINGTSIVCQGQSNISYSVPVISNATSYIWSYSGTGASINGTTSSISINFSANATSGNLTVKGNNSCGDGVISSNYPITINPLPLAAGNISGTAVVCQGQSNISYSVPVISNTSSYTWSYSGTGASINGSTSSTTINFSSNATSGNLTVRGNNACGDGLISANYPITINPLPSASGNISGTASVCQGQNNVSFSVGVISNATSYIWSYSGTGASINGSTSSITINFSSNATSGNLTVKGNNACGDGVISANYPITINPLPSASGSISGSVSVCQGQNNVIYKVPAISNATSYIWVYSGTGASLNGSSDSITISFSPTATSGNLTVKGNNACGDGIISANYPLTVNPLPAASLSISGNSSVCQGANNVSYNVPPISNATSYTWDYSGIGATVNGSSDNITISFSPTATSGNLTVKGNNACGDGTISANYPITVNPLPAVAGIISGAASVCQSESNVVYTIPSILNATSYIWTYSGNGASIIDTNNSIHVSFSANATSGDLTVKGNNSCGDGGTANLHITVNPLPAAAGSISGLTTVYQGQTSVNYSVAPINYAASYFWTLPNGASGNISANNITVNYGSSAISGNITVTPHNSCGDGSSSDLAITVLCTAPSTQSTAFTSSEKTNTSMKIAWTRGNGNAVLVIARQGSPVNAEPDNGVIYTADTVLGIGTEIGTGNYVVYNGTGNSVILSSLLPETFYHFAIYEYNSSSNCYKTPGLLGNSITSALNSTFTAAVSNTWENPDNWNHGIPSYETNVLIPADKHAIVNSNNYACNNLSIGPKGKLTINAGINLNINGLLKIQSDASGSGSLIHFNSLNATVECYIPHNYPPNQDEFHMLASPVTNQHIAPDFNATNGFYAWSENNGSWIEYADAINFTAANAGDTIFIPGKGYAVSYDSTVTKSFTGLLNQDTVIIPLTTTAGIYEGFNFIANPYPSSINWNASNGWTRNMLEDAGGTEYAIWIWNPNPAVGQYGTYISNADSSTFINGVTNNIAMAQGFWVKATNPGNLIMTNEIREHSNQSFLKSSSTYSKAIRLAINSTANSYSDELIIKFGNGNDIGGAEKMFSLYPSAPSLYSTKLNKKWSINNLTSVQNNTTIPIGFKAGADGNYCISLKGNQSLGNLTLEDIKLGVLHNLSGNAHYNFSGLICDDPDRFLLHFSATGVNEVLSNTPEIYYNNHNLSILNPWNDITTVNIFDVNGRLIASYPAKKGSEIYNFSINPGVYIIKLLNKYQTFVKKVVVY
jgi:hypothetical protein